MEQIIEFRLPKIQWSLYDEDDLHAIEERLFNVTYSPSDDVQRIVNYRAKRLNVQRPLKLQQKEFKKVKLGTDVVSLKQRIQRRTTFKVFSQHKSCFPADCGTQILRDSDLSTNVCFEYLHRHPSPVFSSILRSPACWRGRTFPNLIQIPFYKGLECDLKVMDVQLADKTFSMLDFNFKNILKLRRFYSFAAHMTDTALIKFVMLIILQLRDLNTSSIHMITIMDRIQRCFDGKPVKMCPGIIVCAPPGTGKSHFVDATGHFMLDTDFLLHNTIDQDVSILKNLVDSGFSLITNRFEYEKFSEWAVTVLICFEYSRRVSSYGKQGIFEQFQKLSDERRRKLEQISFKYVRRSICPIPVEEWEHNLERGLKVLPFLILKDDQSLEEAMVKVYQALIV